MRQSIIFVPHFTREWLEVALDIYSKLELEQERIRVIDVSSFSFPRRFDLDSKFVIENYPILEKVDAEILNKTPFDDQIKREIVFACEQSMKSLTRMEKPTSISIPNFIAKKLMLKRAMGLWQAMWRGRADFSSVSTVYVPNGRFPVDKVLSRFFRDLGVRTKYWEMNSSHSGYFLSDWPIQEWSKTRPTIKTYVEEFLEDDERASWALKWIKDRESNSKNPFAKYWLPAQGQGFIEGNREEKLAVFFSSSSDEIGAMPPSEVTELHNQHSAVRLLAEAFVSSNYKLLIRIHPNLNNKPLSQFINEFRAYRKISKQFRNVKIIRPWSKINSYALVRKADVVLVHGSTIGLEASALGKQVITTQRTSYSEVIDVLEILSEKDLPKLHIKKSVVDPRKALLYIEYTNRHKIIVPRPIEELRSRQNQKAVIGIRVLIDNPVDALFSFWFNHKWVFTKVFVNGFLRPFSGRKGES